MPNACILLNKAPIMVKLPKCFCRANDVTSIADGISRYNLNFKIIYILRMNYYEHLLDTEFPVV
jgi:hypothetical protein